MKSIFEFLQNLKEKLNFNTDKKEIFSIIIGLVTTILMFFFMLLFFLISLSTFGENFLWLIFLILMIVSLFPVLIFFYSYRKNNKVKIFNEKKERDKNYLAPFFFICEFIKFIQT